MGAGENDEEAFGASGGSDAVEGRQFPFQHVLVEEEECAAGDVLCGGDDVLLHGEVREELPDVFQEL